MKAITDNYSKQWFVTMYRVSKLCPFQKGLYQVTVESASTAPSEEFVVSG
jgi:hypothetical protein